MALVTTGAKKHTGVFKTVECQIMDWADDTAYAINDLVDSISGGFISIYKLLKWKEENLNKISDLQLQYLDKIIDWVKKGNLVE